MRNVIMYAFRLTIGKMIKMSGNKDRFIDADTCRDGKPQFFKDGASGALDM